MPKSTEPTVTPQPTPPSKALKRIERKTQDVVESSRGYLEIEDDDTQAAAAAFVTEVLNPVLAEIAETFDPIEQAQKQALKVTRGQRKTLEDPVAETKKLIRTALERYELGKRMARRRLEERMRQRQIQANLETNGGEDFDPLAGASVAPPPETLSTPEVKAEGVAYTESWDFEVVDASRLRPEFLVPDDKSIRKLVKSMGERSVSTVSLDSMRPAIRVFPSLTSRTSTRG